MKLPVFLLVAAVFCAASRVSAAGLGDDKTVYILPMSNGLDQYLAIKLTTGDIMQVVTDPQKADAVLTDHIGASFEQTLNDLYGQKPKEKDDKDLGGADVNRVIPGSRGRGAIFLVDRKTRNVIWSDYERRKNSSPDELNHVAEKIANKLEKDRKGK